MKEQRHMLKMSKKRQNQTCKNCRASFLKKSDLKNHKAQCDTFVPYSCPLCDELFDTKNEREQHKQKGVNM